MVMGDPPSFATVFFGAILLGAVLVPVNPRYQAADYRFLAEDSEAEVVDDASLRDPRSIKFHTLRHTATTQWRRHGIDVEVISHRLGHANPGFTMRVYQHVLPGDQTEAAVVLDAVWA
jgi:integrase